MRFPRGKASFVHTGDVPLYCHCRKVSRERCQVNTCEFTFPFVNSGVFNASVVSPPKCQGFSRHGTDVFSKCSPAQEDRTNPFKSISCRRTVSFVLISQPQSQKRLLLSSVNTENPFDFTARRHVIKLRASGGRLSPRATLRIRRASRHVSRD